MRNTWHFTLPTNLLLPSANHLAAEQEISTLSKNALEKLNDFFQLFAEYSDLPFGLNPRKHREMRHELAAIRNGQNNLRQLGDFIKRLRKIKEDHENKKSEALSNNLSIHTLYSAEDLTFIANKILLPIENYIQKAQREIKKKPLPEESDHPLRIFHRFIQTINEQIQAEQQKLAHSMQLTLEKIDRSNNLSILTKKEFKLFITYILKYADEHTKYAFKQLNWTQNTKPKKPRWPAWFFRGENILHNAFSDRYQQTDLFLKSRILDQIDTSNITEIDRAQLIQRTFETEEARLIGLRKRLFLFFHKNERIKIKNQIEKIRKIKNKAQNICLQLQEKIIQQSIEEDTKQQRRAHIIQKTQKYNESTAESYFYSLLTEENQTIIIDGQSFENNSITKAEMRESLKNLHNIQPLLIKKIHQITIGEIAEISTLIQLLGTQETKSLWSYQMEQFHFQYFIAIISNSNNSESLYYDFIHMLNQSGQDFPISSAVNQQLIQILQQLPHSSWTQYQHFACEAIQSHHFLSQYYPKAMACKGFADLIIQRFQDEQLTEIEFPELRQPLNTLIRNRLAEKEAEATAEVIKAELDHGQVASALSRVHQLEKTLEKKESQTALLIIADKLTQKPAASLNTSAHQILKKLRILLHDKKNNPNYLTELNELHSLSELLPFTQEYAAIKRLCAAAADIPNFINELPNAIITLANNEIKYLHHINPLLLDIIEADLIQDDMKSSLQSLVNAAIDSSENNLPASEIRRLQALKNALDGNLNTQDKQCFFTQIGNSSALFTYRTTSETTKGNTHDTLSNTR